MKKTILLVVLLAMLLPAALACIYPDIDIKPGSYPNSINLKNKGVVAVAVFCEDGFKVNTIYHNTVRFAGAAPVKYSYEDKNGDRCKDVVYHFKTQDLDLEKGDTSATISGRWNDGISSNRLFEGGDSVRIIH